jgi:hypothetical protein
MFYLGESTTSTLPIMGTALERENYDDERTRTSTQY